ncbi:uncharacterized protein PHACADRAFT_214184 [Phanerochaete carnosa HHB-10118-sp]|uniref:BTB domain-containing protein n=1 Tax=Phanerochaete carnosa (strain HHB-10118-sp) TaxID=650164 RepID=K5UJA7_PHACS|nr:uncharacterized protein PHACADRAFT_214184 [Phanerochaete carnosa HHB-10118-sp]EKM49651.1 hypothetical protein PHACADRAFT_214184 [Phanerochaete carnosa HHB-10118-sp]
MAADTDREIPVHTLSRHPDLWFEDGNIVLQAEDTVFKVFKSVLSKHALLFADIFSLPQPSKEQEQYDGCVLVKVHDEPKHMATFLQAIFDPTFLLGDSCSGHEYAELLRLSTKYQAHSLRRQVFTFLQHDYPDTLSKYDHVVGDGCQCSVSRGVKGRGWALDAAVANAARDADAPLLLPAALLSLYSAGMDIIVDAGSSGLLQPLNRDVLLKAIPGMWSLGKELTFEPLFSEQMHITTKCNSTSTGACFRNRHKLRAELEVAPSLMNPVTPVSFQPGGTVAGFCSSCQKAVQERYEKVRQEAWDKIPEAFRLPEWDEMRKREEELYSTTGPGSGAIA